MSGFYSTVCLASATLVTSCVDISLLCTATSATQVMGHMAVPMVLKNTNVKVATHQAPLTGENHAEGGERKGKKERAREWYSSSEKYVRSPRRSSCCGAS